MTVDRMPAGRARPAGAGLTLAVLSAAAFSTSGTFASSLFGTGWSPAAAVLARLTVAAILLTIPALVQLRGRWPLLRRGAGRAAGYGLVAGAGAQLCYFNAVARIPVGVALLLDYMGVILVVGWLWLRHGQRPRRLTVFGGVLAMAGLAGVLDLAGPARLDPLGVMWGLLAAVGLGAFFLLSARTEAEPLPPIAMTWVAMWTGAAFVSALGWAGAVRLAATAGPARLLGHQVSWLVPVTGLALLAAVVGYVAGIGAARRLGAKLTSFISMSEVLFAIGFAWLLLGQLPSATQFAGGALILAGVVLVRADELRGRGRRRAPQARRTSVSRPARRRAWPVCWAGKGSSPSPEGRHTGALSRPAAGPGVHGGRDLRLFCTTGRRSPGAFGRR